MDDSVTVTQVKHLRPDSFGCKLLGLVICKHSPRKFNDSRFGDQSSSKRCVLSFTLRDASGFVNCSAWGSEEFIMGIASQFQIGDMVVVANAQIAMKSPSDEVFNPTNAYPFGVSISEKQGGCVAILEQDCSDLNFLLHAPIRPSNDFYTLAEVYEQGQSMDGQYINILAVVKKITDVQQLVTKNGKELEKLEVTFFDSTSDAFTVIVWEREYFGYIQQWIAKRSVIFAVDIRLNFNKFKNCMQGTFTSKTVCVQDPDINEAHQLYDYALEYAGQMEDLFGDSKDEKDGSFVGDDDLKVYTIEEVLNENSEMANLADNSGNPRSIRGILYATITKFNIDGKGMPPWCLRCSSCRYRVQAREATACPNDQCVTKEDASRFSVERSFDIDMALSDYTGTLEQCRIGGTSAETMLRLTVDDFECLGASDVTDLKWSWLMEYCKVRFRYNSSQPTARPRIELCEKPNLEQALSAIHA